MRASAILRDVCVACMCAFVSRNDRRSGPCVACMCAIVTRNDRRSAPCESTPIYVEMFDVNVTCECRSSVPKAMALLFDVRPKAVLERSFSVLCGRQTRDTCELSLILLTRPCFSATRLCRLCVGSVMSRRLPVPPSVLNSCFACKGAFQTLVVHRSCGTLTVWDSLETCEPSSKEPALVGLIVSSPRHRCRGSNVHGS
eukprot:6213828-Pleurochrysis_carterae.AAC.2